MLKEIQQEILSLRKTLSELKIGFKEMKEQIKLKDSDEKHKNTLMIEMMRKIIENGGDSKLKASMEAVLDNKRMDINIVKSDLEMFKGEELVDIIKNQINIYDEEKNKILNKQFEELKNNIKENINQYDPNVNKNSIKIDSFEAFLKKEESQKKESRKMSNKTSKVEKEEKSNEEKEEEQSEKK